MLFIQPFILQAWGYFPYSIQYCHFKNLLIAFLSKLSNMWLTNNCAYSTYFNINKLSCYLCNNKDCKYCTTGYGIYSMLWCFRFLKHSTYTSEDIKLVNDPDMMYVTFHWLQSCVCVHVHMYVRVCVCVCVRVHMYVRVCVCVCMCVLMCACMCVLMCTHVNSIITLYYQTLYCIIIMYCMCVCVCVRACVHGCVYISCVCILIM